MQEFTTMIMAGGKGTRLHPLTRDRSKSAIRFGGIYRIIDFTLSNCINSGIKRIYLLSQYASTSLERHLRQGWTRYFNADLGEFIETRPPQLLEGSEWYYGTANSVFQNIDVLQAETGQGTLILSGDHIYKMDYRKMIEFHQSKDADLTIACVDLPVENARNFGVMETDGDFNVIGFEEKPENPKTLTDNPNKILCNMGVYYFRKNALIEVLSYDNQDGNSQHDFGKDIIPYMLQNDMKVAAYLFYDENDKESKYWRDIGTIDGYYEANMELVAIEPMFNLYDEKWPIKCNIPQLPPTKTVFNWNDVNRVGMALDSLVSPGVIISGGKVFYSILSPKVRVHSYAMVSNSILFDEADIGRGAVVNRAIIDREVNIPAGAQIGINLAEDQRRFHVSEKGVCVVTSSF